LVGAVYAAVPPATDPHQSADSAAVHTRTRAHDDTVGNVSVRVKMLTDRQLGLFYYYTKPRKIRGKCINKRIWLRYGPGDSRALTVIDVAKRCSKVLSLVCKAVLFGN